MPTRMTCLIALLTTAMMLFGCKGEEASEGGGSAAESAPSKPLTELFASTGPTFPEPATKLAFGMIEAEASQAAPEIFGAEFQELDLEAYGKGVDIGPSWAMTSGDLVLAGVSVTVPEEKGLEALHTNWGEPVVLERNWENPGTGAKERQTIRYWFSPEQKMRAIARPHMGRSDRITVEIGPYIPIEDFIGKDGPRLGLESEAPILGATAHTLQKAYTHRLFLYEQEAITGGKVKRGSLRLAPTDFESDSVLVSLEFENDVVARYDTWVQYRDDAGRDRAFKAIEARFGALEEAGKTTFAGPPEVRVGHDERQSRVTLEVGPKGGSF